MFTWGCLLRNINKMEKAVGSACCSFPRAELVTVEDTPVTRFSPLTAIHPWRKDDINAFNRCVCISSLTVHGLLCDQQLCPWNF